MAPNFLGLDTESAGEKPNFQSNRANDNFAKVTQGSHESPDSSRWGLVDVAGVDSKGVDMPTRPDAPALKPSL